jgi:hypothetical protein
MRAVAGFARIQAVVWSASAGLSCASVEHPARQLVSSVERLASLIECWSTSDRILRAVAGCRSLVYARPPDPKTDAGLVFLRADGSGWSVEPKLPAPRTGTNGEDHEHDETAKMPSTNSPVAHTTRKLLLDLGLHRPGLGFYSLRHVFLTIAEESRDHIAVAHVMGHVVPERKGGQNGMGVRTIL